MGPRGKPEDDGGRGSCLKGDWASSGKPPLDQTRLTANDVDVVDMFGFANGAQSYMKNVEAPNWQQFIDAGLLMDLSDQPFIKNYDAATLKDAGTYNGKVYEINLGRVTYSGLYYNKDLFALFGKSKRQCA